MNKNRKIPLFSIILTLWIAAAYSQDTASVRNDIIGKLHKYCERLPREELFVHTDRAEFVAGELVWFNIYLVDRQSNKPSKNSRIAYVELLNSENRPVVQKQVRLHDGSGPGQLDLPDTLSTGKYTIRAYTNWMRNFMPENCFTKDVQIYNAFKTLTGIRTSKKRNLKNSISGNSLPAGISNPGLALQINNLLPDTLKISISADDKFRSDNNYYCHLLIQTHGEINLFKSVKLSSSSMTVNLSKNILLPGINQVTLFNYVGQPLAERFIYTPSEEKRILKVNSPESINAREQISLEIRPEKSNNISFDLKKLSISIAEVTECKQFNDITDYMVFGTEFGELPDEIRNNKLSSLSPEFIDHFLSSVRSSWIDWGAILAGNFPKVKYPAEKEEHYLRGILLDKISDKPEYDKIVFLSVPDKTATFQYARTDSSGSFAFHIPIDEKIRSFIIQPEEADENTTTRIESPFAGEYRPVIDPTDSLTGSIPEALSDWTANYQIRKIYGIPENGEALIPEISSSRAKRFYGKPDIELVMADYIKLATMEEVFFELTPGIIFKSKKSGYSASIFDPVGKMILKKPPVLFIDGVVVNDPAVIAGLDPGLVEKIDAVTDLYLVGDYCFFGLINLITLAGDYSSVTLPPYAVRVNFRALDPVLSFYSPDYKNVEKKKSRIPDLRNTLYWNPSVRPDSDGVFRIDLWASDNTGTYEINLQGISPEGKSIALRKTIRIE